ncbi:MAG: Asp-tRNA(Asn)/Glu-tRNA(Gln) amidotransferase subunit GatC [Parcubacteria group bacterium]|nr:Asp-tRNA(Asn)/Glu-tRNA(Gln) amidotransferase subunit GatC [Parcubacteria group bacterium]
MDKKELQKLATLARIAVSSDELQTLQKDMEGVLQYISQIQEVSAGHHETKNGFSLQNVMREDKDSHESGAYTKELLAEAPQKKDGYIQVKKIISA